MSITLPTYQPPSTYQPPFIRRFPRPIGYAINSVVTTGMLTLVSLPFGGDYNESSSSFLNERLLTKTACFAAFAFTFPLVEALIDKINQKNVAKAKDLGLRNVFIYPSAASALLLTLPLVAAVYFSINKSYEEVPDPCQVYADMAVVREHMALPEKKCMVLECIGAYSDDCPLVPSRPSSLFDVIVFPILYTMSKSIHKEERSIHEVVLHEIVLPFERVKDSVSQLFSKTFYRELSPTTEGKVS